VDGIADAHVALRRFTTADLTSSTSTGSQLPARLAGWRPRVPHAVCPAKLTEPTLRSFQMLMANGRRKTLRVTSEA